MNLEQPCLLESGKKLPWLDSLPLAAGLKFYSLTGFEIPSLPSLSPSDSHSQRALVQEILYRFQLYLLELHQAGYGRSLALQWTAHPERHTYLSRVGIYILCRSANINQATASEDVERFAQQAYDSFPRGELFQYGQPRWLEREELEALCWQTLDSPPPQLMELRKFEEIQGQEGDQEALRYVPHRYWADQRRDSWLGLLETLSACKKTATVRVEVAPLRLDKGPAQELLSTVLHWYTVIDEDMNRKASHGEQVRTDGVMTDDMMRSPLVNWARTRAKFVQRGKHTYDQLLANGDRLFSMRVLLAAEGVIPAGLIGGVRAALSMPPVDQPEGVIGWARPVAVEASEQVDAQMCLRWMTQTNWGQSTEKPALYRDLDLRSLATADEAVSLFHLPIFDRVGQTSALSTAETPFVIPPESLDRHRFSPRATRIRIGFLYQREKLLSPDSLGEEAQPFCITTSDLMKPSLLVGAPGSGKTNLAVSLLIQLWKERRPFLVLDPSTGQEFRLLLGERSLRKELVVFTVGDPDGFPLQFNPFSVPPGVTVRNHTTRLMAAFRAATTMQDPIPAVFEAALERLYTDETYCGKGRAMQMEQKGDLDSPAPSFLDFSRAMDEEVKGILAQYEGSKEATGIIRGATSVRVQSIAKKLGHILNVPGNGGGFFQNLLQRPAVIELGSLGDSANIALLMAFVLAQLSGHVEFAYRRMAAEGKKREHLILIEEAHRLLAKGEGAQAKSAEDLNIMLAEVRKFGQGIMTLDQRPSSLVGGVLDNAFVKILTRLSDREGFDRLSDELNLNEAQQRFARTRLRAGDAILLDREAGLPVLVRADNVKDDLEKGQLSEAEFAEMARANAQRFQLVPPEAEVPPRPGAVLERAQPTPAVQGSAQPALEGPEGRLRERLQGWLKLERPEMAATACQYLNQPNPDVEKARAAVDRALESDRTEFDAAVQELWEQTKWEALQQLAGKYGLKAAADQIELERHKPSPASGALGRDWLWLETRRLLEGFLDDLNRHVAYAIYPLLAQSDPEVERAKALADAQCEVRREAFQEICYTILEKLKWALVGSVADQYRFENAREIVRQLRTQAPERTGPHEPSNSREWLTQKFVERAEHFLERERTDLVSKAHAEMKKDVPDIEGARALVDAGLAGERQEFDQLADELWDQFQWAFLGSITEKYEQRDAHTKIRRLREAGRESDIPGTVEGGL
jgi:hypothetical protein